MNSLGALEVQGRRFEDLSVEERAMVVGGLIAVGVGFVCLLVFTRFFFGEYSHRFSESFKSGSSIFTIVPLVIGFTYLIIIIPMAAVAAVTMGLYAKRSFGYVVKIFAVPLLVVGSILLADTLLFVLFEALFSNLLVSAQFLFILFTCLGSGMIGGYVLHTRRVNGYLRKITE